VIRHAIHRRLLVALIAAGATICLAAPAQAAKPYDWTNAKLTLPWASAPMQHGQSCPGGRLQFTAIGESTPDVGLASRDGFTYTIHVVDTADVTGDRRPDTVVRLACHDGRDGLQDQMGWYYLYTVRHNRPVLLDFMTSSDERANADYAVQGVDASHGRIDVTQYVRVLPDLVARTFTWTGRELVADQPLPPYPEADIAP
jgi:hypothetical protein